MEIELVENNKPSLLWKNVKEKPYFVSLEEKQISITINSKENKTVLFNVKNYPFDLKIEVI